MPEKRLLGLTSARKAGVGPTPRCLSNLRTSGPLTDAGVAGLRGIFRDDDGMLHTVLFADELHRAAAS